MAYSINYDESQVLPKLGGKLRKIGILFLLAAVILCAIAVKTVCLPWVEDVLMVSDPKVTAAALDALLEDIQQGIPISQALEVFCREIIAHAS